MATQYTAGLSAGQVLTAATMNTIGAAWESYTPSLTQNATVTKTVVYAKYTQINKLCIANIRMTVTGAGTAGNAVVVGLPLSSAATSSINVGTMLIYDSSTATSYAGAARVASGTTVNFVGDWSGNNFFGAIPNLGLAVDDQVILCLMYEVA